MAVTIRDVAALAGVSPSTVSRTCKDHSSISRETKEKVRYAMAQLGYEPNITSNTHAEQMSLHLQEMFMKIHFIWRRFVVLVNFVMDVAISVQL